MPKHSPILRQTGVSEPSRKAKRSDVVSVTLPNDPPTTARQAHLVEIDHCKLGVYLKHSNAPCRPWVTIAVARDGLIQGGLVTQEMPDGKAILAFIDGMQCRDNTANGTPRPDSEKGAEEPIVPKAFVVDRCHLRARSHLARANKVNPIVPLEDAGPIPIRLKGGLERLYRFTEYAIQPAGCALRTEVLLQRPMVYSSLTFEDLERMIAKFVGHNLYQLNLG